VALAGARARAPQSATVFVSLYHASAGYHRTNYPFKGTRSPPPSPASPPALPLPSPPLRRIRIIGRGIFYRVAPLFQSGIKGAAPRPADWRRLSARLGNVATLRIILGVGDRVGFLVAASRQFVRRLSRRAHRFPPPA